MTDFIHIQRKLVNILLSIPTTETFGGRSRLLDGLPPVALNRSEINARDDLGSIINGLHRLGRLTDQGGTRPLVVVIENALQYVPPTSEVASILNEVRLEIEKFYGGETIPPVVNTSPTELEALVFGPQRDTRLPFSFIENARRAARSVARLLVPRIFNGTRNGSMYGTGWLIAPSLILTNHHVINARVPPQEQAAQDSDFQAQAEQVEAWFDYWQEGGGHLTCLGANLVASDRELDYALLQLTDSDVVADRQPLKIVANPSQLVRGARLNIAQHARGGPLQFAIRNNFYVQNGASEATIHYQTDTEPGASGSPVCDDNWYVLGLHHASVGTVAQQVPQEVVHGQPVSVNILNEAVTIHAILNHLPAACRESIIQIQLNT